MQKVSCSPGHRALACVALLLLLPLAGCDKGRPAVTFTSEYQAVFMDNGQVFFGKLEQANSEMPLLKDVYFVQNQSNPETKEVKSLLIKRGKELHEPDLMYLNARHIVFMEPVGKESRVAKLISEAAASTVKGQSHEN